MDNKINIIVCSCGMEKMWEMADEEGCFITYAFKEHNSKVLSLMHKLWIKYNLPFEEIWFNKELENLTGVCVLMDAEPSIKFVEWLKERSKAIRLIYYYWNAYEPYRIHPDELKKLGYEVWSFDPQNCIDFNMNLNPEFYCKSWYKNLNVIQPAYDVVFIGRDKNGRMKQVEQIVQRFANQQISWNLYFTASRWYKRFTNKKYRKYLNFEEMLKVEMNAKIILDYSQTIQSSITCRTYDALYNGRKVMTNNQLIMQEPYYCKENVFIIDVDEDKKLYEFIHSPLKKIDPKILKSKSFDGWKMRFLEE